MLGLLRRVAFDGLRLSGFCLCPQSPIPLPNPAQPEPVEGHVPTLAPQPFPPCANNETRSQSPAISASFLARLHPLILRLAAKASSRVWKLSDHTSATGLRLAV